MIDFTKYDKDYELPVNPANFIDFCDVGTTDNSFCPEMFNMQADAYMECADELAKWLHGNVRTANAFDVGVILYLGNHSIELKLKAILLKLGNTNIKTHAVQTLFDKIPDSVFVLGLEKSKFEDLIDLFSRHNTPQNELGRYIEDNRHTHLAHNNAGIVYTQLMDMMYDYHLLHDKLDDLYSRIEGQ